MFLAGMTFRDAINNNKEKVIEFLTANGLSCTRDICDKYNGEKEMVAVRKALNELRKEGKVSTDDKTHFWQGKFWELTKPQTVNQMAKHPSFRGEPK